MEYTYISHEVLVEHTQSIADRQKHSLRDQWSIADIDRSAALLAAGRGSIGLRDDTRSEDAHIA